jgi:hypothetical protein
VKMSNLFLSPFYSIIPGNWSLSRHRRQSKRTGGLFHYPTRTPSSTTLTNSMSSFRSIPRNIPNPLLRLKLIPTCFQYAFDISYRITSHQNHLVDTITLSFIVRSLALHYTAKEYSIGTRRLSLWRGRREEKGGRETSVEEFELNLNKVESYRTRLH